MKWCHAPFYIRQNKLAIKDNFWNTTSGSQIYIFVHCNIGVFILGSSSLKIGGELSGMNCPGASCPDTNEINPYSTWSQSFKWNILRLLIFSVKSDNIVLIFTMLFVVFTNNFLLSQLTMPLYISVPWIHKVHHWFPLSFWSMLKHPELRNAMCLVYVSLR